MRSWYGDTMGVITPLKAKIMSEDLTCLMIAHLSNYIPAVMPELKPEALRLTARILDLEIVSKEL